MSLVSFANRAQDDERRTLVRPPAQTAHSEAARHGVRPKPIVVRRSDRENLIADHFDAVSILFADIVGFTPTAALMSPAHLVGVLDSLFSAFDEVALRLGVEKIKTMGDSYMAAAGLPVPTSDHAERMAQFAFAILDIVSRTSGPDGSSFQLRIGMHAGPVVAGVIGRQKFIYDVWGDTVNIASRLESQGFPGKIQISEAMRAALAHRYRAQPCGVLSLRGRGDASTYLLLPEFRDCKPLA
jgi:class 3 adenylate cyclase